ncbi:uncharacterized protein VTP21DRAFT_10051 [Calcarisporiella thermophila]|uniref:uncharacterized protein n=1 Tax=Calcarisporiella thermophila TaxID=911321 RepID=UPI0037449963
MVEKEEHRQRLRVVSLLPSAAECIAMVAGADVIVGRSHEDDFPPSIQSCPILTSAKTKFTTSADVDRQVSEALSQGQSLYDLNVELLSSLKPDVVITQDLCHVCSIDLITVQRIAKQLDPEPKVVTLNPLCFEDVLKDIEVVGDALQMPLQAQRAVDHLSRRMQYAESIAKENMAKKNGKRITCLFLEWVDPCFVGGHWTPQLIHKAGGLHSLNAPPSEYKGASRSVALSNEIVANSQPEVIIVCPCGLDIEETEREMKSVVTLPWWKEMAEQAKKIVYVDGNQMFNRPGPRLVDAFEWLVGYLHDRPDIIPEGFPYKIIK